MKYIKWILGLGINTPTYIVLEEAKREKMWVEARGRAEGNENFPHTILKTTRF